MNESFVSAEVQYPVKLISDKKVLKMLIDNELKPVHVQLYPTNRCNLHCPWCSCDDRDKTAELDIKKIKRFFDKYDSIQSVTISGGGEPLIYGNFIELIDYLYNKNIKIGMATNGYLIDRYNPELFKKFTWIRISLSEISDEVLINVISNYIDKVNIDWAFSFVSGECLSNNIQTLELFYNRFKDRITHFRVVGDILNPDDRVNKIHEFFESKKEYDKFIFQSRQTFTRGMKKCYLPILKPVITATGDIQSCCGSQYAILGQNKDCSKLLSLGNIDDEEVLLSRNYFDTKGICYKCYYDSYNKFIDMFFQDKIKHEEFI